MTRLTTLSVTSAGTATGSVATWAIFQASCSCLGRPAALGWTRTWWVIGPGIASPRSGAPSHTLPRSHPPRHHVGRGARLGGPWSPRARATDPGGWATCSWRRVRTGENAKHRHLQELRGHWTIASCGLAHVDVGGRWEG